MQNKQYWNNTNGVKKSKKQEEIKLLQKDKKWQDKKIRERKWNNKRNIWRIFYFKKKHIYKNYKNKEKKHRKQHKMRKGQQVDKKFNYWKFRINIILKKYIKW